MKGCIRAGVLLLVALACASAADFTRTVPVPPSSRIEAPTLTRLGDWEVTISFDTELCEILCAYHLRPDRFGRAPMADLVLPPIVSIQVYADAVSNPATLIIDPAGAARPVAAATVQPAREESMLAGERILPNPRAVRSAVIAAAIDRSPAPIAAPAVDLPANLPLRI